MPSQLYYCAACARSQSAPPPCPRCGCTTSVRVAEFSIEVEGLDLVAHRLGAAFASLGRAVASAAASFPAIPSIPPIPAIPGIPPLRTMSALPGFSGSAPRRSRVRTALLREADGEPTPPPAEAGSGEPVPAAARDPFRGLEPDELTPEELTDYLSVERVATVLHCTPEAINLMCGQPDPRRLLQPIKSGNRWLFRAANVRAYQLWAQEQNEQRRRGRPRAVGRIIPPFEESPER